ncbi:MAG: ArnT family glycosyltransferase [Elusimicrobiota bacterium]
MTLLASRRARLAAAVFALSLAVHAKGIRAPLLDYHYHRQVNTASIARRYWRDGQPLLQPRIDWAGPGDGMAATEFPVEMWLQGKLWPVFGLGEAWGRIISAGASAITAVLLLVLFELEFGTDAGFFGAALFTVLPVEIYFGRTVQPEALALLGFVSALYFWRRSLEPGRPTGPWLAAVASTFLAVGLKLPYAPVLLPLAALSWRRLGRAAMTDARSWTAALAAATAVLAWYHHASTGSFVVPTNGGEIQRFLDYDRRVPYYIRFLIFSRFPELVTTYAGGIFFFVGARDIFFRRRDPFWLALFFGPFVSLIAFGSYAHIHEYTCLPLAVGAAGLMGLGLQLLKEKASAAAPPRRAWAAAGLALLVAAVPVHAALRVGHWYNQSYAYLGGAAAAAEAVSRPGEPFLTNGVAVSVLLYYLDRRGWGEDFQVLGAPAQAALIDERTREGARFLASEKAGLFAEPDGTLWRLMRSRGAPVWDDGKLVIFPLAADAAARGSSAARP